MGLALAFLGGTTFFVSIALGYCMTSKSHLKVGNEDLKIEIQALKNKLSKEV